MAKNQPGIRARFGENTMRRIVMFALLLALGIPAFAGDNYPLTMTGVFTKGRLLRSSLHETTYTSGDYECTSGDEHNAPTCHTIAEWAQLDSIGGIPDTIVFTMADGSKVGVHSLTVHKIPGYIECTPSVSHIFCNLYFEFLGRQQISMLRQTKYGQTESMSSEEYAAAEEARHRELFGAGNTMTLTFRYKLKGKPENGFQRIELDKKSCVTGDAGTNYCDKGIISIMNRRGDGYIVGDTVQFPHFDEASPDLIKPAAAPKSAIEIVRTNSEAAKSSPAAAASLAIDGKQFTQQELTELVKQGKASRCAVITVPAGAEVDIDGNKMGVTPVVFILIQRDTPRTVTVKMDGYKTVEKQIVPDGKIVPISLQLEKN